MQGPSRPTRKWFGGASVRHDACRNAAFKLLWTAQHSEAARAEHWDVYEVDSSRRHEIQTTDGNPGPFPSGLRHNGDQLAVLHVAVMAIFGNSLLHQLALKFEHAAHREFYEARR